MNILGTTRLLMFSLLFSLSMQAQTEPNPAPHTAPNTVPKTSEAASSPDYSGMYTFLQEGEFLQLTIEDEGIVTGFVSRYKDDKGDDEANRTFIDHFFKKSKLDGKNLFFTTEFAQNLSYEFKGTIERGQGKAPQDEDYYALTGTLTQHRITPDKKTSSTSQQVTFKSFPQDVGTDAPK